MAVMTGSGLSKGLPFTFQVWIDHSDVAHGTFSGTVPSPTGTLVIEGPVTCAWIEGNIGVFGGRTEPAETDFTVMVSDRPDGMIIGTGRFGCDTNGFGDPASLPITAGDILVSPEPQPARRRGIECVRQIVPPVRPLSPRGG